MIDQYSSSKEKNGWRCSFLVVTGSNSVFTIVGTFTVSKSNKHGHAPNAVFVVSVSSHSLFWRPFSVKLA